MNKGHPLFTLQRAAVPALVLGFGLGFCLSVTAQNLLNSGDFSQPLGPTNWTIECAHGGPDDFDIKDRITGGRAMFRPSDTIRLAHIYYTQTITNLDTNHLYTVSGYMWEGWWRGDQTGGGGTGYDPSGDGQRDKFLVYIEAIGGLGDPTPDGRASLLATNPSPVYPGFPDLVNYATGSSSEYRVQQTPDARGKLEVRLHYNKVNQVIYDKCWLMHGVFGPISVTP